MTTSSFDYVQFINEGFDAQQKYASKANEDGPRDFQVLDTFLQTHPERSIDTFSETLKSRYAKMIEHFGHMVEETIEARVYVPRRSWKNGERSFMDDPALRKEFIAEMYDILLFHRAILAYGGVTGEEFAEVAAQKQAYNQVRPDHNVNGTEAPASDPLAELHGDCPSANYSV